VMRKGQEALHSSRKLQGGGLSYHTHYPPSVVHGSFKMGGVVPRQGRIAISELQSIYVFRLIPIG